MTPDSLCWILTLVFAAAGAFTFCRGVRRASAVDRVGATLHLALSAGMITMVWPATAGVARVPQLLLYGGSAVWFAVLPAFDAPARRGKLELGFPVAMAAAALWMALTMPVASPGMAAEMPAGGAHAGMSMTDGAATAPHVAVVAVVWTVIFVAAGTGWLWRAVHTARVRRSFPSPAAQALANAAMGLGMAVMTGALV
ncbi:DUF5134 domain-containing protein [Amycolatopsis sp. lyj-23]|uniref:DUF5134 domain-containing protein n=1 Tax=Amycolatopsis sp. lyj-23 TaxID=2789283 RepID=UPI003978E93F